MKKPYQIESQRAVKQLEAMAADGNPAVQMVLPMAEMVGWLRQGVGELIRQAGLQLMDLLMQEEVRELAGERSQRQAERTASRWGSERGYCVVMGQKVPIERPRVRTTDDKEVRLGSYEMFHRGEPSPACSGCRRIAAAAGNDCHDGGCRAETPPRQGRRKTRRTPSAEARSWEPTRRRSGCRGCRQAVIGASRD
jgi:hypothetical protein